MISYFHKQYKKIDCSRTVLLKISQIDSQKSSDLNDDESFEKVRKLIKHVADIIWNTLSKSHYKDKPHLQSIYSYLTGQNQLIRE